MRTRTLCWIVAALAGCSSERATVPADAAAVDRQLAELSPDRSLDQLQALDRAVVDLLSPDRARDQAAHPKEAGSKDKSATADKALDKTVAKDKGTLPDKGGTLPDKGGTLPDKGTTLDQGPTADAPKTCGKLRCDCTAFSTKQNKWLPLWGKVSQVSFNPDFKVKIDTTFGALKVQQATSFATKCGQWLNASSGQAFTYQLVTFGEDFTIGYDQIFPGINKTWCPSCN